MSKANGRWACLLVRTALSNTVGDEDTGSSPVKEIENSPRKNKKVSECSTI